MAPRLAARAIESAGQVLNIGWVIEALNKPARIICPRSTSCPRQVPCERLPAMRRTTDLAEIRREILETQS